MSGPTSEPIDPARSLEKIVDLVTDATLVDAIGDAVLAIGLAAEAGYIDGQAGRALLLRLGNRLGSD